MTNIILKNPSLVIGEWIPTGRNNMNFLNRHLGSHKRYSAPTEFGISGSIDDISKGEFKMEGHGFYLYPDSYKFSEFLRARMTSEFAKGSEKGIELDKDGACLVGLKFLESIDINSLKLLIAEHENDFAQEFLSLLNENQKRLLNSAYDVDDITVSKNILSSYSLVITEDIGIQIKSAQSFMQNKEQMDLLAPVTDWVINYFSIENCHIFIGVKAMVCIGVPSLKIKKMLKQVLIQKTIQTISLQMFNTLWKTSKTLLKIGSEIPKAPYKKLKSFNQKLFEINDNFSRQMLLNDLLLAAIENKNEAWKKILHQFSSFEKIDTGEGYEEEKEKAKDRNMVIKQMSIDIDGLRNQLQQKISLIMTKNGQELNLTLLLLTLISVLGIEVIFDFNFNKFILVSVVLIPFLLFTFKSFFYYRKHFQEQTVWQFIRLKIKQFFSN